MQPSWKQSPNLVTLLASKSDFAQHLKMQEIRVNLIGSINNFTTVMKLTEITSPPRLNKTFPVFQALTRPRHKRTRGFRTQGS
jgi:hypothetical protein